MVKFEVITNRRLGVIAEIIQSMLNDGWETTGPMFVLPSGIIAQPLRKEVAEKRKRSVKQRVEDKTEPKKELESAA